MERYGLAVGCTVSLETYMTVILVRYGIAKRHSKLSRLRVKS